MKYYELVFPGLALGGVAIVESDSTQNAINKLKNSVEFKKYVEDYKYEYKNNPLMTEELANKNLNDIECVSIREKEERDCIFFWNGDY